MPAGTLIPLSEYLATSYRPDREYLDGELLERNVGEWDHSRLQMLLSGYFFAREREWGILVVPEQRVQVKANRFRIPDISVLLSTAPKTPILREPPFLCIEILSRDDRMTEMQERVNDYLEFGVTNVWVIDPRTRHALVYTRERVEQVKNGILCTENPAFRVLFSELE